MSIVFSIIFRSKKMPTSVSAKFADYDMFAEYCEKNNISISKLFQNSAKYCINNNIDIADYKENK